MTVVYSLCMETKHRKHRNMKAKNGFKFRQNTFAPCMYKFESMQASWASRTLLGLCYIFCVQKFSEVKSTNFVKTCLQGF